MWQIAITGYFLSDQIRNSHAFNLRSETKHPEEPNAVPVHGEVRQVCGRHLFVGRRDLFFGLIFLFYAPRGCRFEPVQTESGYVHRSKDVCDRIQLSLSRLDE